MFDAAFFCTGYGSHDGSSYYRKCGLGRDGIELRSSPRGVPVFRNILQDADTTVVMADPMLLADTLPDV